VFRLEADEGGAAAVEVVVDAVVVVVVVVADATDGEGLLEHAAAHTRMIAMAARQTTTTG
jgi:Flp pilus assembly pilin Flp